ncbi:uncharacterized protein LOC123958966 [Micropterus dolomieu]|uniref:uncharacterized protein LOC123958966 n=1 Tax=Micropterus dolomieu TaxID=147949 RepID=UPI001E8DF190|nr:uncharacterized protein LOC123958966 [Micropterus dolomieu]
MSIDGTKLLFEGFLQKRKDTMVQSVREVNRGDSKRFMFEIIMTNGKRKVLAAETAALRKEWIGYLWQAMHLSSSGVSDTHHEVCEQRERINSSAPICSYSDSVMELLPARPLSAPAPTGHIHHEIRSITPPSCLSEELNSEGATFQMTLPVCNYQHYNGDSLNSAQWSSGLSNAEGNQGDYDVLPLRKNICESNTAPEMDEGVYDFPLSYRRASDALDPTESIYDVPSSLLRNLSDEMSDDQQEDGLYWRI